MRKRMMGGLAVLMVALLAWAGNDPWKSKPFQQWDQKDITQILQESPWAKSGLQAAGSWRPVGQSTTEGQGAYSGRSANNADGGAERTKDAMSGVRVYAVSDELLPVAKKLDLVSLTISGFEFTRDDLLKWPIGTIDQQHPRRPSDADRSGA